MARTLTQAIRRQLYKQQSSVVLPILLDIDHASLSAPIRVVNNTEALTYGGNTYSPYAFRFDPPDETEDAISNARLTIDATDQTLIATIRSLSTSPTITGRAMFYYDESGTVEFEPIATWEFSLRNVQYDVSTISGELVYEDRLMNQMGPVEMTPQTFPGIF